MRSNNLPASEVRPKHKSRFMTNYDYSIHYKRYHDGSPEDIERMALVYKKMLLSLLLPYPRSTKVLDYGCGDGALVNYLSRHFDDVFGVDASKEQIETGIRNGVNIEYLPLKNFEDWCESNAGTYDIVFTFDVLEHVPVADQIPFLRHLAMLLKPGGSLFVKVPNANSLLASRWRYSDWTHHSSFTEASLDFVLQNSGFTDIQYFPDESQIKPDYWWIPRISLTRFYLKSIFNWLWYCYLRCELGKEARSIPTGINLFARATFKPKTESNEHAKA